MRHRVRFVPVSLVTTLLFRRAWPVLLCTLGAAPVPAPAGGVDLREDAIGALRRAASFYHGQVASHGGYAYYYSLDLQQRWGEGKVSADTVLVQPPGTPTVGMAYLEAYAATGDTFHLDAARAAAAALAYGQLESGGWTQVIHFGPAARLGKYRHGKGGTWNASSLDDGQTQAALQFLVRIDQALEFRCGEVHDAALYGLEALLKAQFPNGAFPQVWTGPVESKPVVRARFPGDDWRTAGRVKNYWDFYTLNDGLAGTVADTLIAAHRVYKDERYRAALERLGGFLVLAQMPEPQPGWCQQYSYEMVPIWARRFEPPAVSGWESQDVMEALVRIARYTGKAAYLDPIPRALGYFRRCLLPDGQVARFYEFGTNKALYMDAGYALTYDSVAAPAHYGWQQPARFEAIVGAYQEARTGRSPAPVRPAQELAGPVRQIVQDLDAQGRWVTTYAGERLVGQPEFSPSFRYLSSAVFSRHVAVLSEYLVATRGEGQAGR